MVVNKGKVSAKEGKEELVKKTLGDNSVEGVFTAKDLRKRGAERSVSWVMG